MKRRQDVLCNELVKLVEPKNRKKFKDLFLAYSLVMMQTGKKPVKKTNEYIEKLMSKYKLGDKVK